MSATTHALDSELHTHETQPTGATMSILSNIASGFSKGVHFVLTVLTRTPEVITLIGKLGPATIAAIMAVFYDVMQGALVAETAAADAAQGRVGAAAAIVLSDTTKTLVAKLVADWRAAEGKVVEDFKALNIAVRVDDQLGEQAGAVAGIGYDRNRDNLAKAAQIPTLRAPNTL